MSRLPDTNPYKRVVGAGRGGGVDRRMEANLMKKPVAAFLACLTLTAALPAQADPYYGHRRHYRPPPPVVQHHHHHRHGHPLAWGLAGLALGGALYATISAPPPVVVAPPPVRPPERLWYYCESYRAYYPQVQYCPEGWRAVPGY